MIAGQLRRNYVILPSNQALLDVPGGNLLYAAVGVAVWEADPPPAVVARVGEDYPAEWLEDFARENDGEDFITSFEEDTYEAINVCDAAKQGLSAVTANMKEDDPDKLKPGTVYLDGWEIESVPFWFTDFLRMRNMWKDLIEVQEMEYTKLYDKWLLELDWMINDKMFAGTENMSDWTWPELGPKFRELQIKVR